MLNKISTFQIETGPYCAWAHLGPTHLPEPQPGVGGQWRDTGDPVATGNMLRTEAAGQEVGGERPHKPLQSPCQKANAGPHTRYLNM